MPKNRKHQKFSNEMSRRGNMAEGRMDPRHRIYAPMVSRAADRFPRDGVLPGLPPLPPPHVWPGPPPYRSSHESPVQYPPAMPQHSDSPAGYGPGLPSHPSSEMNMRVMPANVPHAYFQQRNDNRNLQHRLFNEHYRYAGPQQTYAPPDINNHVAGFSSHARIVPNGVHQANERSFGKFQLRGDAPEFVPRYKSDDESFVHKFDQFDSSDSSLKVEELDLRSDEDKKKSPAERVAWLVVSSTR
ncbi:hypothetical protein P170DRAFT_475218 [Aspergillus steynii IBT 23096]|uniref:Uncharacterized protein n=1 Tax=Aspergillus steynii IBT 23096 TaxID=1392250 RepID=A0A2I2G7P1_9EURO|nr:uncharacterized protein P170DRAFT_475218 [Aspergillus steynii IBT 23096]PLB48888.1 hypothetical protein P170DRAFT_475218 [Aspergillus steynii IBT 23096]